jgi:hypothetical protein
MAVYDLGDVVTIPATITDQTTGNPLDAGSITLTVTKPDGTTDPFNGGQITHDSTGNYHVDYTPAAAGRYTYRWVVTGTGAGAYTDVFDVLAADPQLLISLSQARAGLRLPVGQTVDDEDLRQLIAAAAGPMEDLCGPILARACDEWHDGGATSVRLLQAPAMSITAVVECYGAGYARPLTQQPLDGSTFDAFGYTVDLVDAIITRRASGTAVAFVAGRRNIHVTYPAGRAVISQNLLRATRRLIRWLWQTEMQGQRPTGQAPDQVTFTPAGFAVPNAVAELCAAERRLPGIG